MKLGKSTNLDSGQTVGNNTYMLRKGRNGETEV